MAVKKWQLEVEGLAVDEAKRHFVNVLEEIEAKILEKQDCIDCHETMISDLDMEISDLRGEVMAIELEIEALTPGTDAYRQRLEERGQGRIV